MPESGYWRIFNKGPSFICPRLMFVYVPGNGSSHTQPRIFTSNHLQNVPTCRVNALILATMASDHRNPLTLLLFSSSAFPHFWSAFSGIHKAGYAC